MAKAITKEFVLDEITRINASTAVDGFKLELTSDFNAAQRFVLVMRRNTMYNPVAEGDLLDIYNVLKGVGIGFNMQGIEVKKSSKPVDSKVDLNGDKQMLDYLRSHMGSKSPFVIVAEKHIVNPTMCNTHWELSVSPTELHKGTDCLNLSFASELHVKNSHGFSVDVVQIPKLVVEITDCKTMKGVSAEILRVVNNYFYDNAPFGEVNEVYLNRLLWLTRENLVKLGFPLVGLTTRRVSHRLKEDMI